MPTARLGLATCAIDGIIYAIGGASKASYPLTVVEAYNPVTNEWTKKADMPTDRYFFSASVVNNKIYTIGGSFGGPNDILSVVEEYDPATDSWSRKRDMPTKRFSPASVVMNGKIYAIGGAAGYNPLPIIEVYNPSKNEWKCLPTHFNPRVGSACIVDDKIFHIGGALTVTPPHIAVSTVEIYSPLEK